MVLKGYHIFLKITDLICMRTENIKKIPYLRKVSEVVLSTRPAGLVASKHASAETAKKARGWSAPGWTRAVLPGYLTAGPGEWG